MWRRSVVHIRNTGLSPEPEHYATGIIVITRRRSFAPSIGNTLWRVSTTFTRSAMTPPEVNEFGSNLGNSENIVWNWPWQILVAIRAEARAGDLAEVLFYLSGKQRTTLLISAQPNFTKFAHKTWFCEVVKPFGIIFWKFVLKWSFLEKTVIIVNDFRLQAAISRKRLQILENHDRLARLWNPGFPSVPLKSTQSHSPGQQAPHKEGLSNAESVHRMTFIDASLPNGHAASACSQLTWHYIITNSFAGRQHHLDVALLVSFE